MTKKEIVETIKKMDNAKVVNLWNKYVGEKCYPHENVQSFTDWNDAKSPIDIDILVDWLFEKEN